MDRNETYDIWSDVIDSNMTRDSAETWKLFWEDQEPLSDAEFDLLKSLCYEGNHSKEEHDLLFKLVNRELTLRIKNHRENEEAMLKSEAS